MSDLIERLRRTTFEDGDSSRDEAADEIERLRRLAENWHGDLTVREQQVERLARELAEARADRDLWRRRAEATGWPTEADRDAFLAKQEVPR